MGRTPRTVENIRCAQRRASYEWLHVRYKYLQEHKRLELADQHSPFGVEARVVKSGGHGQGWKPGGRADPAVALLLRRAPVGTVAGRVQERLGELLGSGCGFLNTDDVRARLAEPGCKAFFLGDAEAVHIPRQKFSAHDEVSSYTARR